MLVLMRSRTPELLWALSRALYQNHLPLPARVVKALNWMLHKCLLPAEAVVGDGVILEHYALGIVIHPQVTLGKNCRIYHQVSLATEAAIGSPYRIILGDDVTIGTHSIVLGKPGASRKIGNGSILGAGSVLLADIPDGEVWAGNPARKIRDVVEK